MCVPVMTGQHWIKHYTNSITIAYGRMYPPPEVYCYAAITTFTLNLKTHLYHLTMQCDDVFMFTSVCASICLSVCNAPKFESRPRILMFIVQVHLQNIEVKFIYQCHRVKVMVTRAKSGSIFPVHGWSPFD